MEVLGIDAVMSEITEERIPVNRMWTEGSYSEIKMIELATGLVSTIYYVEDGVIRHFGGRLD